MEAAEPGREVSRWELLLDAVVTMGAGLSLDELLGRIVATSATLAGARYAALGVLDQGPGRRLRTFVHQGIGAEEADTIGHLPAGHGLLGLIIDRPEPLRLHDIGSHPASAGFPEHHPPMHSFLGVPVRTRDQVFGNLYLTEKEGGGDFTEADERIVTSLAAAAGVAVENAQLLAAARRGERWMSATAAVTSLVAAAAGDDDAAVHLVAERARDLAGADVAWVVAGPDADSMRFQAVAGAGLRLEDIADLPLEGSVAQAVVLSGVAQVRRDLDHDPRQRIAASSVPTWPALDSAMLLPLSHATGTTGVLCLGWTAEHSGRADELDPALPAAYAEQAATALQLARSRAVEAQVAVLEDRDRIGRDLHDLVIQRLFAVGLSLQGALRLSPDPELAARVEQAVDDLDATIKDIRATIFELASPEEADDLQTEVGRLVERAAHAMGARPQLVLSGPLRTLVPPDLGAEVVAVLTEALSNVVRHARAGRLEVRLEVRLGGVEEVVLEVEDDGRGLPEDVTEGGLRNLRERAVRRGGTFDVGPGRVGGTRLRWAVPLLRP